MLRYQVQKLVVHILLKVSNVGPVIVKCFFCDTESGEMHQASTMTLDANIRKCATDMWDSRIIAKLSAGDVVSREAWYHKSCLTKYSNKYRSFVRQKSKKEMEKSKLQTIALSEVIIYIRGTGHHAKPHTIHLRLPPETSVP